jgi:hypothetical protein
MTERALSFTGIGIANAGFPAKFTAAVFCRSNTCASKRAVLLFLPEGSAARAALVSEGKSVREIATVFKVHAATIYRLAPS